MGSSIHNKLKDRKETGRNGNTLQAEGNKSITAWGKKEQDIFQTQSIGCKREISLERKAGARL